MKRPVTTATIVAAALALGNFLAVRASAAGTREIIGWAPLHLAAAIGHAPTVRALLAVGANPEVKSLDNRTPLFVAAKRGRVEAVCALLEGGANIHSRNAKSGFTPLHVAAEYRQAEVMELPSRPAPTSTHATDAGGPRSCGLPRAATRTW